MTTATQAGISVGSWQIDGAHTEIGFSVRHLMSKVRGTFESFSGTLVTADDIADSRVSVEVDLSSINTGESGRDEHLRSNDFFDVEQHPKMTFDTTGVTASGDQEYTLVGNLTIKDVTRPIELSVEFMGEGPDPWGGTRIGVEVTGSINRKDFGIDFNVPMEGDRVMIGNKIDIHINAEAVLS